MLYYKVSDYTYQISNCLLQSCIRFLRSNHGGVENQETSAPPRNGMQMVSCGADKSIIFRDISLDEKGQPEFQRINHIVGKTTLYDMEIDVRGHSQIAFTLIKFMKHQGGL